MSRNDRQSPATVEHFCREHFPEHFTGVAVEQQTLLVYRRPHSGFDRRVRAEFPHLSRFVDSDSSRRQLVALQGRVRADHQEWLDRGLRINSIGLTADRVIVGVRSADLTRARPAIERYGPAVLVQASDPMLA
ncbi:hypothetical protein [Plantactinospora sp. WMMB782]|uniref:hypothetical protein n=1 Tax=Plantactinospora sp. WMMB782 TaxID=3404121 RepID=UPI003B957FAC